VSSVDVSTLTDTTLSAVATATDAAGNVSAFSTAATSVKDTVAPAKPVISALTNPITAANVTAVALTGTAEPDSALSIDLSDGTNHVTKQTTADGSGDWSISNADVSSLSDGTVTAVATATDAAGNASPGSDGVTAPKHTVVPSAPQQLAATPQDGALHITWTAPATDGGSSVTGYTLTVTPHGSDTPVSTTSPAAAAVASTISGLTNGTAYDVAMTATNAAGTGPAATASGTPRTVPDAPTGVLVTPGDGDLSVSWTAPLSDGGNAIDSYTVTANPGNHTVSTADGDTTNADLTGLTNGTLYTLTVAGHNAAGDGTSSASATGTPRTVAGAPTDVLVTPGDGDLSVSWVAPSVTGGADIDKYTVTANPGGITVSTADGETTNADLTGLANGTRYTLTVVAHNAAGDGPASAPVSGTPRTVPDAPTGVQVTPGDGQLTVSWSAPAQDGGATIASYTVTANPGSHTATTLDGTTLHAVVSGLTNGTVYSVTVTAHNAAGDGAAATAVNGTPRTVPGAPTGVHVSPGDGAATVTWSAPAQDGGNTITSYTVTATPGSHQFTTADGATHSAHLSGLTNGTQYTFTVTAHNAAGDSGPSAAGVVTPRYLTTLTISTSKTSVSYGTPITLSGQLLDTAHQPVAGASVLIYRVPDAGSTIHLSTVTTNSFGHWTLTYAPGINGVYFARYLGGTADAPAVSRKVGARVAAAVRITSPANNARSSVTSPLVVTGSVTPNKSGATVTLYYVDSKGVAHKLATTPLSPKSAYAFSVKLGKGTWHLLTVIGATTNNIGGRSAILTVSRV
jgi:predicted RNA-binding protein with TRAM domain